MFRSAPLHMIVFHDCSLLVALVNRGCTAVLSAFGCILARYTSSLRKHSWNTSMLLTLCTITGAVFLCLSILPYLVWHYFVSFSPPQDLKRRYNATWALVTGASSGKFQARYLEVVSTNV